MIDLMLDYDNHWLYKL